MSVPSCWFVPCCIFHVEYICSPLCGIIGRDRERRAYNRLHRDHSQNILQVIWFSFSNFKVVKHNCFNPLRLPSKCSPNLNNGIWLVTTQKRFNSFKIQNSMIFINKKKSVKEKDREHLFCVEPNFLQCLVKKLFAKKQRIFFYKINRISIASLYTEGSKILKMPLVRLVPKSVILFLSRLISNLIEVFSKVSDLVHRPTAAVLPAIIAARWHYRLPIKNLTPHYKSQFGVSFNFCIDQEASRRLWTCINGINLDR